MNLKVNQRIEIVVIDEAYRGSYLSRVEHMDEKQVLFAMPMSRGSLVPIRTGTNVSVVYFDELAVYEFQAKVERHQHDNLPVLRVRLPQEVKRIQRRAYVRLEASIRVGLFVQVEEDESVTILSGETADISGGGMRLHLAKNDFSVLYNKFGGDALAGQKFKMILYINEPQLGRAELELLGEIIRFGIIGNSYWLAISFAVISEKNRDRIISYIFKKQLELRNKGLI